jgi:hypothetical protein
MGCPETVGRSEIKRDRQGKQTREGDWLEPHAHALDFSHTHHVLTGMDSLVRTHVIFSITLTLTKLICTTLIYRALKLEA